MPNQPPPELPLTEVTTLILLTLAAGPQHGYAIMKEVHRLSQGRVTLSTGTLYGALKRMLDQGWIERLEETVSGGRVRKAYRLSAAGRDVLQAEVQRLEALVAAARSRPLEDSF